MQPSSFLALFLALPALASSLSGGDVVRNSAAAFAKRSVFSDILTDIEHLAECSGCEALLVVLQGLAHLGNDAFVDVIVDVCQALGVEDDDVWYVLAGRHLW